MQWWKISSMAVICVVVLLSNIPTSDARPSQTYSRQKRVTDHRIHELTLMDTLQKIKPKMVTLPVGFNKIDIAKLGRRRRSAERLLWRLIHDSSPGENEVEEIPQDNEGQGSSEGLNEVLQRFSTEVVEDIMLDKLIDELNNRKQRTEFRHLPVRLTEPE